MQCPRCGTEMREGTCLIHSRPWALLFFGVSSQHLHFYAEGSRRGERVLPNGEQRRAASCPGCGAVLVTEERVE